MSLKLNRWVLGGVTFLVALTVIVVSWERTVGPKVQAASLVNDNPSATGPRSARYVGAYTVPLTADRSEAATASTRVGDILVSSASSSAKAKTLVALFPQLPAAAQPAAAHHIVNLLPNTDYESFAVNLTNATAATEIRAIIYADLLQRPNAIKLPWLLALARSPGIGQAAGATALLRATLREDHGANWNIWSERIRAWLEANPDVPEAKVSN